MTPLHRLDAFLLAQVFQPAVDAAQRPPSWWGRQSAALFGVSLLVLGAVAGWHWLLVVSLLAAPVMVLAASSSAFYAAMGAGTAVRLGLVVVVVGLWTLFAIVLPAWGAVEWLRVLSDVAQLAFFYFAACRPPAPPKRRTAPSRALPSGAA